MYTYALGFSQVTQLTEANSHLSARLTTTTKSIAQRETQLKSVQKKHDDMFDQLNTDEKTAKIELYNLKQAHKQLNKNLEVRT